MILLVTGGPNVGKTTLVRRVVSGLRDRGRRPVGFYTDGGPATRRSSPSSPPARRSPALRSFEGPGDANIGPTVSRAANASIRGCRRRLKSKGSILG
ncbi:MAG: nucleoside-triphosphatase [Halodesulfurarchaeum sp.]